jgi:hypothetical protein
MEDIDTNKFLKNLNPYTNKVLNNIAALNSNLKHLEIEGISKSDGRGSLNQFFQKKPQGVGILDSIETSLQACLEAVSQIEEFRSHQHEVWKSELFKAETERSHQIKHEKDKRKAERRDMWALWLQQTIRWFIGVVLVIFMYSCAVRASELIPFVKIPIKDWLPDHKPLTEVPKAVAANELRPK